MLSDMAAGIEKRDMPQFKFRDNGGILAAKPGDMVSGHIITEPRGKNFVAKIQVNDSILKDAEFIAGTGEGAEVLAVKYVNGAYPDVRWVRP
ncbi:hypothetical protein LR013_01940 [candidate division NPL-UPA2 bacterium]|nr:hypothetical protein [candidate division NPL-UPA2 bacterium]